MFGWDSSSWVLLVVRGILSGFVFVTLVQLIKASVLFLCVQK